MDITAEYSNHEEENQVHINKGDPVLEKFLVKYNFGDFRGITLLLISFCSI